ncbi:family 4 glycosyl hydrolase, alpha-galactosidase/6-phospho-beta-glucosidase [Mesorhizobium australicum WSM2073]|uniref:Family 4 glycosyl hydrolase, alpha-galactosidase/6-phospho-beta-glucosidase n=1 Tax=Mesorhizobium australicum (strain HAMBI 3006 / LMG 24608 / WSM2073) TaxID=754035 RepID=L0KIJ5_MESAW|nr:alpha-glucosidase/alpha-galactosidase [Mesorhizobium australicum]AGB44816.1 family 4 glycosyl hydrolase, alpha-galactosidase/6-phospho-beta-glucosidase [Mesorhizobium australicum WSM2073]
MSFKIAIIGAGSVGFTKKLFTDILCVPEFKDIEFALTDVSEHNLAMIKAILDRIVEANNLPTRVTATTDRRKALEGARYIISCVRVGGLEAYADDIRIPLRYGIDQCVGDTICAGGILYGQRNIPVILDFCKDIREVADTNAKFLNYANPMAMNTWAAIEYGKVDTVGLCHGVQHGAEQIAEVLGAKSPRELDYVCSGINHHPVYSQQEKLRIDVLKRFGVYSTESNGHLSEYLPWYRKRPDEITRWIDMSDWIHGETGGYLRYSTETRNWFETEYPQFLEAASKPIDASRRSNEHASHILEALETNRVYRGHFNVRNDGVITNLPRDAIIESPGFVDRFGINMAAGITLPEACAATCMASINVQRMSVHAAISGDIDLLKLAVLHDPLVGAVSTPEEVWQMVDEMVVAQAQWLPQYAHAVPAAKERLSKSTVKTREWAGAARRSVRSIEELRAEKAALKQAV